MTSSYLLDHRGHSFYVPDDQACGKKRITDMYMKAQPAVRSLSLCWHGLNVLDWDFTIYGYPLTAVQSPRGKRSRLIYSTSTSVPGSTFLISNHAALLFLYEVITYRRSVD